MALSKTKKAILGVTAAFAIGFGSYVGVHRHQIGDAYDIAIRTHEIGEEVEERNITAGTLDSHPEIINELQVVERTMHEHRETYGFSADDDDFLSDLPTWLGAMAADIYTLGGYHVAGKNLSFLVEEYKELHNLEEL